MTRKCFFAELVNLEEGYAFLEAQGAHHVKNVLRLRPGEAIELRDGQGRGWKGSIRDMTEGKVRVQLLEACELPNESPLQLTLGLAFSRADRMDQIVRQATEIGVVRFIAFKAERSQYGLSESQGKSRRERWSKIAQEAMCQCGRMRVPEILLVKDVMDFLSKVGTVANFQEGSLQILAAEEGCKQNILSLWRSYPMYRQVLTVVGPEGGWSPGEMDRFVKAGFHPVHLGPRILRFETAAIVLLSSAQLLWGDFGQPV